MLTNHVAGLGEQTYHILGCSGIARIYFLINSVSQQVYVNEVNTLPGSLYYHNWRQVGISALELVTSLVAFAEERFAKQQQYITTFASGILAQGGGMKNP